MTVLPARSPDEERPSGGLPQPSVAVELAPGEIGAVIAHHEEFAAATRARHDRETELFHLARAGYLRQRLSSVAPHPLTPGKKGHA